MTRQLAGQVQHVAVQAPAGSTLDELRDRLDGTAPDHGMSLGGQTPDELVHGAELSARSPSLRGMPSGVPWLIVATGPDAGGSAPLLPGRWVVIGRDPRCDLPVQDPGLSRRHLRVRQERDGVRVEDLCSTNGLGWELDGDSDRWRPGDRLVVGRSGIVLLTRPHPPAQVAQGEGTSDVTPWPRVRPTIEQQEILTPPPAPRRTVRPPSTWTWSLPLVVALAVAVLLRMPWLLLFGLLGPTMVFGHHLGDRRAARLEHEESVAAYRAELLVNEDRARKALRDQLERRRSLDPGLVGVLSSLLPRPSASLWQRLGEPLVVVLGEHRADSALRHEGRVLEHDAAPLTFSMDQPLALVGPPGPRDGLARSLLLQLATGYPPSHWSLVVPPEDPPEPWWDLLAWIPHTVTDGSPRGLALSWGTDLILVDALEQAPPGTARVLIGGDGHTAGPAVLQIPGRQDVSFSPATIGVARARSFARSLAPLRSRAGSDAATAAGSGAGPLCPAQVGEPSPEVSLGDLGPWPMRPHQAAQDWASPCLEVPLGLDERGCTVTLDLIRDGPHALVAGTTGAGKSELLRTLITALAIRCSPADLALLLVDFKGGSSLGDCAGLPHVTGMVTDLDPHLAQRVLTSLQAELTSREALLASAGVTDISGYAGLPRLVVVIDEFRVLADEVPEVMTGLVRLAAVGRSLGVHLILATQRPAGVVGADLRANVNLRIALRVRDSADSFDVIETPDAALLPEGRPGLALWRTGAQRPRVVQVARAGPPARAADEGWSIEIFEDVWAARRHLERRTTSGHSDATGDLVALTSTLAQCAAQKGIRAPVVWHPPLPPQVMTDPSEPDAWALADLPGRQRRDLLVWQGRNHLALVGAARSGRSTALCSLLLRALPSWLVVFDLGRSLSDTAVRQHPGVCAWVGPEDVAQGLRVLDRTEQVILARQAGDSAGQRLILVLDGWDRFVDHVGEVERGRGVDAALRILREGPAVGVVTVITGDRSLLLGKLASLLPQTWALRLNDPADLLMTGLRASQVPREQPPGRIIGIRDAVEAQVVLPPEKPRYAAPPGAPPFTCTALPRRWTAGDSGPPGTWALGGDDASPVPLPTGSVLVLGPAGSGRSSTLRALQQGRAALIVEGEAPPSASVLQGRLADLAPGDLIVVDDAHLLAATPTEELLMENIGLHRRDLLVAAETDSAAGAFRGLVPQAARQRCAVILQPATPGQGAPVGVQIPVGDVPVPGRGVLVSRGRCTRVQVVSPKEARSRGHPSGTSTPPSPPPT